MERPVSGLSGRRMAGGLTVSCRWLEASGLAGSAEWKPDGRSTNFIRRHTLVEIGSDPLKSADIQSAACE